MKPEHELLILIEGPAQLQQKAILLALAILSGEDRTVRVSVSEIAHYIEMPVKNIPFSINELIKKGWIEQLEPDHYRLHPTAGPPKTDRLYGIHIYKDTENRAPDQGTL